MQPPAQGPRTTLELRSFRTVFRLERRIYKFDRWRIPIPYGIPVVGLGYFAAALLAIVLAGRLPAVGALVGAVPPELRFVLIPGAIGYALNHAQPDGRRAHAFVHAWAKHRLQSRHLSGLRPVAEPRREHRIFEPITLAPEQRGVRGPGLVRIAQPTTVVDDGRRVSLRPAADRASRPKLLDIPTGVEVLWR